MTPTIVSFYTPGNDENYYAINAVRLAQECEDLGLHTDIAEINFNNRPWEQVLKEKPRVILKAMNRVRKPVLWIDVDGSILQQPVFIQQLLERVPDVDFAGVVKFPEKGRPFYMGCSFWNDTDGARQFLEQWHEEYAKEESEELSFGRAFNTVKPSLKWEPLPREYMQIDGRDPITKRSVVIHRLSKGETKRAFYARKQR